MFGILVIFALFSWFWSGWKKIPIGWRALRTFLGKRTHSEVEEGWRWAGWPLGFRAEDCRQAILKLDPIDAITNDNVKVAVDGSIVRRITDLWTFLEVNPKELLQGLDDLWDEIIRCKVRERDLEDVLAMHVALGTDAKNHIHGHATHWGISVDKVMVAGITPSDQKVMDDLELKKREGLQRAGQRVQVGHFADMVRFLSGTTPLDQSDPNSPKGPGLPPELAYEAALIQIDKAESKKLSSSTFGLDAAVVKALVEAVKEMKK